MVAAEAMSRGLPVIVPRRSGVAEIVEDYGAGIVIEEPVVDALSDALNRFDSEREKWQTYGNNGQRAAEEQLTFRSYSSAITDLYRSLL